MKKPVIISTDPGIDDAVALALALFSEKLDVQLVCPLFGNVGIEYTTTNTEKLINFFKKDTKMVQGSKCPLIKKAIDASDIHGKSGLEGFSFPDIKKSKIDTSCTAVEAMHQVVRRNNAKTTLVAIGPLTDIALFIRQYPDDLVKIEELVLMGGALGRGNYGVLSEFNFASDPDAAKIAFDSGLKIRVAPLEVGDQAKIMPTASNEIKHFGPVGDMFYQLFSKYRSGSFEKGLSMYDALAIGLILEPSMFKEVSTRVEIETSSPLTAGASLIDLNGYLKMEDNAFVAVSVDAEKFETWFVESLRKTSEQ